FGASGLAPIAISSELGDLILARGSYRAVFASALALFMLASVLCFRLPEPERAAETHAVQRPIGSLVRQRDLIPLWIAAFAYFSCMAGVLSFMKTFVLATGYASVGSFFGVYVLVALVLRVVLGALPDRAGLGRTLVAAISSYALGVFLLANAS